MRRATPGTHRFRQTGRRGRDPRQAAAGLLLVAALSVSACRHTPTPSNPPTPPTADRNGAPGSAEESPGEDLASQTRTMAARAMAAVEAGGFKFDSDNPALDPFAGAQPLNLQRPAQPPATPIIEADARDWLGPNAGNLRNPSPAALNANALSPAPPPAPDTPDAVEKAAAQPRFLTLSREELVEGLIRDLQRGTDPALAKAVAGAGLSLLSFHGKLDPRLTEHLHPLQRERVVRLHALLQAIYQSTLSDAGRVDRAAILAHLDTAFGDAPIRIAHAALCRSVSSFGVYEPFASNAFLSGQANRAIVYVELEQFTAKSLENGRFEVRLKQELILYNESDGLVVWRHEPTQVVDLSRNQRRDFYIVQMITLPARLANGSYRLKVRITDEHGGSVDETTRKIHIVADPDLIDAVADQSLGS